MKIKFSNLVRGFIFLQNFAFLLFLYYAILLILPVAIWATYNGLISLPFFISFVALIALSFACTTYVWRRLKEQPIQQMRLLYGVEIPLFFLFCIFFWGLREFNPGSALILGTAIACILAFLGEMLFGYAKGDRTLAWLQAIAHSLMLAIALYFGVLLVIYAVPFALNSAFGLLALSPIKQAGLFGMTGALFLCCLLLFFFLSIPVALAILYVQSGLRIISTFASQYGKSRALLVSVAAVTAWIVLFLSFDRQPQIQVFKLLEKPAQTQSAMQELLAKSEEIRSGLLNAYLHPYRYLGTAENNQNVRQMYDKFYNLPEGFSQLLQKSSDRLLAPFLYKGSESDIEKAEQLYAQFFDEPIQKAEKPAVEGALQSVALFNKHKQALKNIDSQNVWLRSQEVTVKPHGDWADVEISEVYENKKYDNYEEAIYYFSLPESAVITGAWLDSEDLKQRIPFEIAPRNAAREVSKLGDRTLLEQIGMHHYRLKIASIPSQNLSSYRRFYSFKPREIHLGLTYKVMQQKEGWAMPELLEKRNIFWTEETKRIRNGKEVKNLQNDWLESFLPADGEYLPTSHQVNLATGTRISAKPWDKQNDSFSKNKRFAVILDTSRSMSDRDRQIAEALGWLKKRGFADSNLSNNDADLYVTASDNRQPQRIDDLTQFDVTQITFYGKLPLDKMLQQFVKLQGDTRYDGILLLTDAGDRDFFDDSLKKKGAMFGADVPALPAPLWIVQLETMPIAYDEATLKAILYSGGGVSTEISDVLQRIATKAALGGSAVNVVDGYAWFLEKSDSKTKAVAAPSPASAKDNFEQFAARQLIFSLCEKINGEQLEQLDAIHAIAKRYNIVSPYSSAIAIDNDWLREQLKKAEAKKDRFYKF